MKNNLSELKTETKVVEALERASSKKPTASEILEQRVSFVYGTLSTRSDVTKSRVKELLVQQDG